MQERCHQSSSNFRTAIDQAAIKDFACRKAYRSQVHCSLSQVRNVGVSFALKQSLRSVRTSLPISAMIDVTQILSRIESGDPIAAEQLLPRVYRPGRIRICDL